MRILTKGAAYVDIRSTAFWILTLSHILFIASTVAVFQPGSVHPSAILYEAFEEFTARDAHAHESISSIKADLVEAVDTCIDAAGKEIDVKWQRKLLKAASFGKTFLDLYNPADFIGMSRTLRVLNAVRYYKIGIPISYDQ